MLSNYNNREDSNSQASAIILTILTTLSSCLLGLVCACLRVGSDLNPDGSIPRAIRTGLLALIVGCVSVCVCLELELVFGARCSSSTHAPNLDNSMSPSS